MYHNMPILSESKLDKPLNEKQSLDIELSLQNCIYNCSLFRLPSSLNPKKIGGISQNSVSPFVFNLLMGFFRHCVWQVI